MPETRQPSTLTPGPLSLSQSPIVGSKAGGGGAGQTAMFTFGDANWHKHGESPMRCMKVQEQVNSAGYSGCLKNTCIYILRCSSGCSLGGEIGEMGGCGNAHFLPEQYKEEAPAELQRLFGLAEKPAIKHCFFVAGALGGQGGRGGGPKSPGRGGRGGKAGRGGGKGGGRGNS